MITYRMDWGGQVDLKYFGEGEDTMTVRKI